MTEIAEALRLALRLILDLDRELFQTIGLSLRVSLSAAVLAFLLFGPAGAGQAVLRFRGRGALVLVANALLGLPPVVVGLAVYLLVSRSGPLGGRGLLFTPGAMILAQTLLAAPIVLSLTHRVCEPLWGEYGDALLADGAGLLRAVAP